jgi:hypothetical protein
MFQNNQAPQLPVPYNGIDPSTQNPNLPQGNDRVPQIQLSPWMNQNQQIGLYAIGLFRSIAQSAVGNSATHVAAYNLLSQNQFQNQLYPQWCQMAVELTELLIRAKNYQPEAAVKMAAQRVYEALLGMVFQTYTQLQQVTDSKFWPGLQTAAQIYQQVVNDINGFRNGGMQQQPQQNFQQGNGSYNGGSQLPPINFQQQNNAYSQPQNNGINNFQTSGNGPAYSQPSAYSQPTAHGAEGVGNSFYDDPAPVKPLRPVEEISSDNTDYFGNPIRQEQQPMQTFNQPTSGNEFHPTEDYTDLPAPMSVDDVVMDPTYYTPKGFKLDINRPYDAIYSPGGVVTRPAQQVDWELTVGDDMPWEQMVDPSRFCLFYVKFPDGAVKEKFVEWTATMNYLQHEQDAEMRRKAYRPNGEVVASDTPISTIGGDAATESDVFSMVQDGHLKRSAVPPVILATTFSGATDLEVEMTVREELQNLLEVAFTKDIPMPAAEYRSTFLHPINVSEECFNKLTMVSKQEELSQVALQLRELVLQDVLPVRYFRFINDRLTKAVNGVLADGMTLNMDITDFCEDYLELEDYLASKKGDAMVQVLRGSVHSVLNKAMHLMETVESTDADATPVYQIADNYINFQLGWTLDQLSTQNVRNGKAVLISASAHPTLLEALRGMITRAATNEEFVAGTMRLITSDGVYLEVIKGRLMQKATLLKMIK